MEVKSYASKLYYFIAGDQKAFLITLRDKFNII